MGHRLVRSALMTIGLFATCGLKVKERGPVGHDSLEPRAMRNPRKPLILVRMAEIEPTTWIRRANESLNMLIQQAASRSVPS